MASNLTNEEEKIFNYPGKNARSKVWEHFGFVKVKDGPPTKENLDMSKALCKICRKMYSYNVPPRMLRRTQRPVITLRKLHVPAAPPAPKPNKADVKSLVEYIVKQNESVLSKNDATRLKPATRQLLKMSGVPMTSPSAANNAIPIINIPSANEDKITSLGLGGKSQLYSQVPVVLPDGRKTTVIHARSLLKPLGALLKPPVTNISQQSSQANDGNCAVSAGSSPRITSATSRTTTSNPMLVFSTGTSASDINLKPTDRTITDASILVPTNPTDTCHLRTTDAQLFSQSMVSMAVNNDKSNELLSVNSVDLVCGVAIKALLENESNSLITLDMVYYFCNFCTFKTGDKNEFVCHVASHKFLCTYCDYQSLSRAKIIKHMVEDHKQFSEIAENIEYCALLHDFLKRTKVNTDEVDDFELPTNKIKSIIPQGYESVPVKVGYTLSKSNAKVISTDNQQHATTPLIPVTPQTSEKTSTTNPAASKLLNDVHKPAIQSHTSARIITLNTSSLGSLTKLVSSYPVSHASSSSTTTPPSSTIASDSDKLVSLSSSNPSDDANPSHSTVCLACHGCNFVTQDLELFNLHAKGHESKLQKPLFMVIPRELAKQIKYLDGVRKTHVESGNLAYLSQSVILNLMEKPDENVDALDKETTDVRAKCDAIMQTENYSDDDDDDNEGGLSIPDADQIIIPDDVSTDIPDTECITLSDSSQIVVEDDIGSLNINVEDEIANSSELLEDVSPDEEPNTTLQSSDLSVNQTDQKDVRCYECFNCHGQTLDLDTMSGHLRREHVGHYFIAVDLRAKQLKKSRYVMFCGKEGCSYYSKNAEKYFEHSIQCTPEITEFGCILDSAGRTIEFAKKIIHKINKDSYSCHYCDYKSFYITQVQKHLKMHHESQERIIMFAKVGLGDRPTVRYICGMCLNYKTSRQNKLSLHIRVRHGSGKRSDVNEPGINAIGGCRTDEHKKKQFQEPLDSEILAANYEPIQKKRRKRDGGASYPLADYDKLMDDYLNREADTMMSATKRTRRAAVKAQVRLTGDPPAWFHCKHCEFCCLGVKMIRQHMVTKHPQERLCAVDLDKKMFHKPSNMHICPGENCTFIHWAEDVMNEHTSRVHGKAGDSSVPSIVPADIEIKTECDAVDEGSHDYGNEVTNHVDNEDSNDDSSDDGSVPNVGDIVDEIDIKMECETIYENGGNELTVDDSSDDSDYDEDDIKEADIKEDEIKKENIVDCNVDCKEDSSIEVGDGKVGNYEGDVKSTDHEINTSPFNSTCSIEMIENEHESSIENANDEILRFYDKFTGD